MSDILNKLSSDMRAMEDNIILQLFEITNYPDIKKELFIRLFPDIENYEKWIIIFPESMNRNGELNYLNGFEWVFFSNCVGTILTVDPDSLSDKLIFDNFK